MKVGSMDLGRFATVLTREHFEELRSGMALARGSLTSRRIWNVSSTAQGGGVAEMLTTLLAYARGVGVDARWEVIGGDSAFFTITKRLHNRLHGYRGDGGPLGECEREHYERTLAKNAEALAAALAPDDAVILHDPQTAGLVAAVRACGVPVIWRCHVGVDHSNGSAREAWRFLERYVTEADACVFSRRAFVWAELDPARVRIIPPSLDAFAPKNQQLGEVSVAAILSAAGIRGGGSAALAGFRRMDGTVDFVSRRATVTEDRPLRRGDELVVQVSRWDALKDPQGVVRSFAEHIAPRSDAHLIYAGPEVDGVADDPEGLRVLEEVQAQWRSLPASVRARVHLAELPMSDPEENAVIVNALQRAATVVVQKSLAEGFGLTIAEAMWKARPVVASRIGGIQDQIDDGRTGLLLDDPTELTAFAGAVCGLLKDPARAQAMGVAAREWVRERFLGPRSLLDYLALLDRVINEPSQLTAAGTAS
ncbi:MAG TPA: glycosyltransferase [Solirubrobacteraceae bacterium]|nr:glycosyltransferase [Solirubrobacteraceae bacterium]